MKLNIKKISMGSICGLGALVFPTVALVGCSLSDKEIHAEYSMNLLKDQNHKFVQLKSQNKEKTHYFLIMLDSMSSARMYDTYQSYNDTIQVDSKVKEINEKISKLQKNIEKAENEKASGKFEYYDEDNNQKVPINYYLMTRKRVLTNYQTELSKTLEGADSTNKYKDTFKDFNLYMNVTSPGGATHSGLLGVLGGANYQIMTSEFRKRETDHRKWLFNDVYSKIFDSIGQSDNIDKIILGGLEYYDSRMQHDRIHDWNIDKMPWSEKTKNKIIKDSNMASNVKKLNSSSSVLSSLDLLEGHQNENTFNFVTTNIIHDSNYIWEYQNGLMETFESFRKKLVQLGIWESSEIIVVSDHGKRFAGKISADNDAFHEMDKKGAMNLVNGIITDKRDLKLNINKDGLKNHFPSQGNNRTIGAYNYYAAGMMAKFPHQTKDSLTIDTKNLYSNYDAMAQLFYDMGVDPYYLQFNYKKYMNFKDETNNDGSWNSFVDNPLRKDLSNRKLISALQHSYYWGLDYSLDLGDDFIYFDGPYWTQENGKLKFNPDKITSINLKNLPYEGHTWLTNKKNKALETDPYGGYKVAGEFMDKIRALDIGNK